MAGAAMVEGFGCLGERERERGSEGSGKRGLDGSAAMRAEAPDAQTFRRPGDSTSPEAPRVWKFSIRQGFEAFGVM